MNYHILSTTLWVNVKKIVQKFLINRLILLITIHSEFAFVYTHYIGINSFIDLVIL